MDKRIQPKKVEPGAGIDLSKPKSAGKPKRTPEMDRALQRSRQESQDFISGVLSFRLEQEVLDLLMNKANAIGLSAGQLARSWIIERLNQPPQSGFSTNQLTELTSLVREVTAETVKDMNEKFAVQDAMYWTQDTDIRQLAIHLTDEGVFQLARDVASRKTAEDVLKNTWSVLRSTPHTPTQQIGVPVPTLEILTGLAAYALKRADVERGET
jgi:hypothetical protein